MEDRSLISWKKEDKGNFGIAWNGRHGDFEFFAITKLPNLTNYSLSCKMAYMGVDRLWHSSFDVLKDIAEGLFRVWLAAGNLTVSNMSEKDNLTVAYDELFEIILKLEEGSDDLSEYASVLKYQLNQLT